MSVLTPVTALPERNASPAGAVTVNTTRVRLQVSIADFVGNGEATVKLIRQNEGGDWLFVPNGSVIVASSTADKVAEVVVENRVAGTVYHAVVYGASSVQSALRVYLSAVTDPAVSNTTTNDGVQTLTNKTLMSPVIGGVGVTSGAATVVTFSATPAFAAVPTQQITLTNNVTGWTLANGTADQEAVIQFIQDGTGSRTLSGTPANVRLAGNSLTLSTGAGKIDTLTLKWNANLGSPAWIEKSRSLNA